MHSSVSEGISYLNNINLFNLLCPHKYAEFKDNHELIKLNKNDFVYVENDHAKSLYLIEKGKIKIGFVNDNGEEYVKTILKKGEIFGEKVVLGETSRGEYAQCMENGTSLCVVNNDTLESLVRDDKNFSVVLYKLIGLRIKKTERRLQLLLNKDCKTRLIELLEELAEEFGTKIKSGNEVLIMHPYTQNDLAKMIGTSRQTINTVLNELKAKNLLNYERKTITLYKNFLKMTKM
jgi:CRP-like cAMP-binding protein